jgi:uncharacterized protein HemX
MAITAIVVGTVGVGYSIYAGEQQKKQQQKQLKQQEKFNEEAKVRAKEASDRADIEQNRANRKRADVAAIQSKEEQAALSGPAGTMLTGVQGVNPDDLTLGGNTLLGS